MKSKMILLFIAFLLSPTSHGTAESNVDNSKYRELLQQYVDGGGMVDYAGFQREETKLDDYLEILEKADTKSLYRNEQLAFYINAYNAWTIKLILSKYPDIRSIKELVKNSAAFSKARGTKALYV